MQHGLRYLNRATPWLFVCVYGLTAGADLLVLAAIVGMLCAAYMTATEAAP
ncbi:MAG TPA: hypothetical protein VD948_05095 [Rhodothermales bacterium]|nr:hypothetical protein [Rhodothermales bacterium]